jgi:hypothetical protein
MRGTAWPRFAAPSSLRQAVTTALLYLRRRSGWPRAVIPDAQLQFFQGGHLFT